MTRARHSANAVLAALLIAAPGCVTPGRFDVQTRSRAFDSLWTTLDRDFVYLDTADGLNALRDRCRQEAVAARTRREYLRAIVRLLDHFDDPHLDVYNVADYWRITGIRPVRVYEYLGFAGGRWWIELSDSAEPADAATRAALDAATRAAHQVRARERNRGVGLPVVRPDEPCVFELIGVEGARPGALSVELLAGEPGEVVALRLRGVDRVERHLRLRIAAPTEPPPPASQPATAPAPVTARRPRDTGVRHRRLDDGIGLIEVTRVNNQEVVHAFDEALDALFGTRALILDLRMNTGGNTITVERILGRFVDRIRRYGSLHWRTRLVLPLIGEVTTWSSTGMHAWPRKRCYPRPIVVMIDSTTMSGGELLAGGLRDTRGVRLVGCATVGAGAGVMRTHLPDGLVVQFGAFPMRRYDGAPIQTVGVRPDVDLPLDPLRVTVDGWRAIEEWRIATLAVAQAEARVLATLHERRGLLRVRPWP